MATPAGPFNGTLMAVTADGDVIAHALSATLNINQDLPDATTKDSAGWAEHINGLRDWSISVDALQDFLKTFGFEGAFDSVNSRSSLAIVYTTNVSGDIQYTGTANFSGLTNDTPNEGVASWSGEIVGTGALVKSSVS